MRIAVADDGRGIPFDIQARVFDRFGANGPAGLGLPLVKALIELHGGWVALESEPGAGATFTCHLPEARGLAGPPRTLSPRVRAPRFGLTTVAESRSFACLDPRGSAPWPMRRST